MKVQEPMPVVLIGLCVCGSAFPLGLHILAVQQVQDEVGLAQNCPTPSRTYMDNKA